ncbi:hypothetical protein F4U94_17045 [Sphingobium limneticum]|uniref:hypothetical protein n=1 Tax=Sphingobium limneticum TaxID=1007511 RepID=UPI00123D1534|nr:hypothetical protein [Sphingobium limneticum]KAA9013010.1 hypothetical protein F4U94_17045 [Sphingobium limneticum]
MVTLDLRSDIARGYMLLGVFYLHMLFAMLKTVPDPASATAALLQVKLLAGHVSVFFFLSGMGARGLGRRRFDTVAVQSIMLVALAALSHVGGFVLNALIYGPPETLRDIFRALVRPVVYGTGYSTFVAWFFIVLAAVRPLAYLFEYSKLRFAILAAGIVLLIQLAHVMHFPGNLYEWRNWPYALFFFIVGMRIPRNQDVPAWLGLSGLSISLAAAWFNGPDLLNDGLCWTCNADFLPFPIVGSEGFVPLVVAQEIAFLPFLLWASQLRLIPQLPQIAQWFGKASIQFLLLHGWLIAAFYPALVRLFPFPPGPVPYLLTLALNPIVHAAAFLMLRPMLDRSLAWCFSFSRWSVQLVTSSLGSRGRIAAS